MTRLRLSAAGCRYSGYLKLNERAPLWHLAVAGAERNEQT